MRQVRFDKGETMMRMVSLLYLSKLCHNHIINLFSVATIEYTTFLNKIKEMDAVSFVTFEYNRSVLAVWKNALDVGSCLYRASVWNGKPAVIFSQSPGNLSGFGANYHLRQSLVFLNMSILQQPEAYIGGVADLLDKNGKIKNEGTVKFLQSFVDSFVDLIEKHQVKT